MARSWAFLLVFGLALVTTQTAQAATLMPPHKVSCQSPLDTITLVNPIDKYLVFNKPALCLLVY
jgi:hypothetical protein